MPKPEWGKKRVCPTTGKRFYDLNASPIISPYTGQIVTLDIGKSRTMVADAEDAQTKKLKVLDDDDDLLLDDDGFVRVDDHLQVVGHPNVFALGDVAASDPLRSSARNWGYRVVVANVRALRRGGHRKLREFKAAPYRWGSLLGLQPDGLVVVQPYFDSRP